MRHFIVQNFILNPNNEKFVCYIIPLKICLKHNQLNQPKQITISQCLLFTVEEIIYFTGVPKCILESVPGV